MIRVLGCHGAIAAHCNTTAFLLDNDVLIDAGSGVGQLQLDELAGIDHILLSHSHLDHILGVPLMADSVIKLRQALQGNAFQPICVHALPETLETLKTHIFNGVIWPDFTRIPAPDRPVLQLKPFQIGDTLHLPSSGGKADRHIRVLPAAHTVPAVGFALDTPKGWWVYTGDTGPNPKLWQALAGLNIAELVIETAFGNADADLALLSGHLSPHTLAEELKQLHGCVNVHITHPKPGEVPIVLKQIQALSCQHNISTLREGQVFATASN